MTPQRLHAEPLDKCCAKCGTVKPVAEFHRRLDGYQPHCKVCRSQAEKARYERKKREDPRFLADMNERSKQWHAANRPKDIEAQRQRIKEDPEKYRRRNRKWRSKNKEKAAGYTKQWAKKNPEKIRLYARQKRLGRQNPLGVAYGGILMSDPCCFCGDRPVELDHITPRNKGGTDEWSNLTGACRSCNAMKRTDPVLVFLLRQAESRVKI